MGSRLTAYRRGLLALAATVLVLTPILARADVGPPAHMRITEIEPGKYKVTWRVPTVLPARAVPRPLLPEGCEPVGEQSVTSQPGAWVFERTWTCGAPITGREVGIEYPFGDLALTTVARVDLLSGDRFARVISPGDPAWRLPEGTAAPDPVGLSADAALAGVSHAFRSPVHLVFILAAAALGVAAAPLVVTGFTAGQLVGVGLTAGPLAPLGGIPAEIIFAVAAALLAREALRPEAERRGLLPLALAAGLAHGLAVAGLVTSDLGGGEAGFAASIIAALGTDAAHLVGVGVLLGLAHLLARVGVPDRRRRGAAWATGILGMALAIGMAFGGEPSSVSAGVPISTALDAGQPASAGPGGSQRISPAAPDAPLQSFLAIEPFELRHEAMVRLGPLAATFGLDPDGVIEPLDQQAIQTTVTAFVLSRTTLTADGSVVTPLPRRADFMTVSPTGALPRVNPVPEPVAEAVIGVVVAYPADGMAQRVELDWAPFPEAIGTIPATLIDPETNRFELLTADRASLVWENQLSEDPIPTVEAIEVEPVKLPIPLLSIPPFLAALALLIAALMDRRRTLSFAGARVLLVLGLLVGPIAQTAVAMPGSAGRVPSERQARRILAGLLPNIYRALEYRDESAIYDRLAVSVTGETLTDVYLEQRRSLEIEERGGAQARVEAVEVLEVDNVEETGAGFQTRAIWHVGGMVTHFGHRHFRQNRYEALVGVVPVDGVWKIDGIEVMEQERIQ